MVDRGLCRMQRGIGGSLHTVIMVGVLALELLERDVDLVIGELVSLQPVPVSHQASQHLFLISIERQDWICAIVRRRHQEKDEAHTRSRHIWCTVFHARQKRTVSLLLISRLALPSSSILGGLCRFWTKCVDQWRVMRL